MRYGIIVVTVVIALLSTSGCSSPSADSPPDTETVERDSHPDYKDIMGTWQIVSSEWDGSPYEEAIGNRFTFREIKLDAWIKDMGGYLVVDYEIDPTQAPKHFDVTVGFEPNRTHLRGIYELDGDTLRLCFHEGERPAEFKTVQGNFGRYHVFERAAEEDKK
jgi:uncharacterized protein (TIGR03067 family)